MAPRDRGAGLAAASRRLDAHLQPDDRTRRRASGELDDPDCASAWAAALWSAVGERAPREALDVATGAGTVALYWAGLGARTVGLDGSPQLLVEARRAALKRGLAVEFVPGDPAAPDFEAGRFDVVSARVTPGRLDGALRRWADLVRPGGTLVLIGEVAAADDRIAEPLRALFEAARLCDGRAVPTAAIEAEAERAGEADQGRREAVGLHGDVADAEPQLHGEVERDRHARQNREPRQLGADGRENADHDAERIHGTRLPLAAASAMAADFAARIHAERLALPGMDADRADVALAGAVVLEQAALAAGADALVVNERSTRYGVFHRAFG
jgi:SAM-dependent methyltransferase